MVYKKQGFFTSGKELRKSEHRDLCWFHSHGGPLLAMVDHYPIWRKQLYGVVSKNILQLSKGLLLVQVRLVHV